MVGLRVFWCELEDRAAEAEGGEMGLGPSVMGPDVIRSLALVFFFQGWGTMGWF